VDDVAALGRTQARADDQGPHDQGERDKDPRDRGGLADAEHDPGQHHGRRDGDRSGVGRPEVRADGRRHRGEAGGLADHEAPTGKEAPEVAQPFPP
jgi:hypothetical protein